MSYFGPNVGFYVSGYGSGQINCQRKIVLCSSPIVPPCASDGPCLASPRGVSFSPLVLQQMIAQLIHVGNCKITRGATAPDLVVGTVALDRSQLSGKWGKL